MHRLRLLRSCTASRALTPNASGFARREPFHVSCIFITEVANVLVVLERRGILTGASADAAADVLSRLDPIVHPVNSGIAGLRNLAARFGLSAYDASYVALATEFKLPLACGDRPLKIALKAAGVKLA